MIRHLSTSIDALLELSDYRLRRILCSVTDDQGKHPKLGEFKKWLRNEKALGHKLIPSPECDNFDPVNGCLGHEDKKGKCRI